MDIHFHKFETYGLTNISPFQCIKSVFKNVFAADINEQAGITLVESTQLWFFSFIDFVFIAKLSPSPSSNWAVAGSIVSFSVRPASRPAGRPSEIVLSRPSMTLTSKAKLLISMMKL